MTLPNTAFFHMFLSFFMFLDFYMFLRQLGGEISRKEMENVGYRAATQNEPHHIKRGKQQGAPLPAHDQSCRSPQGVPFVWRGNEICQEVSKICDFLFGTCTGVQVLPNLVDREKIDAGQCA